MTFYYSTCEPDFKIRFKTEFCAMHRQKSLVFLCIGTDKIPGDSLGPYTGTLLRSRGHCVYGTMGCTVNATNLAESAARIYREHKDPFIVAIDACLGKREHIGYITLTKGSLRAGAGVSKRLLPVGDIAITGIVTEYGQNGFDRLVSVSPERVRQMGHMLADAIG